MLKPISKKNKNKKQKPVKEDIEEDDEDEEDEEDEDIEEEEDEEVVPTNPKPNNVVPSSVGANLNKEDIFALAQYHIAKASYLLEAFKSFQDSE